MDALLNPTTIQVLDASPSTGQQFGAELAYGFTTYQDRITLSPAVALALSPTSRNYSLLWSVAPYAHTNSIRAHPGKSPWRVSGRSRTPPPQWTTPSSCASPHSSDF